MKWVPGTALLSWKKKVEYPSGFSCLHVVLSALKDIWTLCLCLSVLGVLACGSRRWQIVLWLLHYTMTQSGPLRGYPKGSVSSVLSQIGLLDRKTIGKDFWLDYDLQLFCQSLYVLWQKILVWLPWNGSQGMETAPHTH